ncbi:serine hydrolase [Streptosporangium sp. NPDC004379]|uniref:serine hydrolase n=1 Tax=Streptosporangium sp. NPDC004379 TaxID=3366189 RepID=UPI00369EDAAD
MNLRPRTTGAPALAAIAVAVPLALGGTLPAAADIMNPTADTARPAAAPVRQATTAVAPVRQTAVEAAPTASTEAAPTPTATTAPEIPDTPAGRQLRWFLDATGRVPLSADEIGQHLSADFLKQVTADGFNQFLKGLAGIRLDELTRTDPGFLAGTATVAGQKTDVQLTVDASGKIDGLLVKPSLPPAPKSWSELDARLRELAPRTGFLAAEIDRRGRCETVHGVGADTARPLGSVFKLYVLGAVADRIHAGGLSWETKLTVTPGVKIPAADGLGARPDGSTVTVHEAAKLMISISDNTAADLLLKTVGRKAVEKKVRQWSGHAERNLPLITTRELFLLKGVDYPRHARAYLARDTQGRRAYLRDVVAGLSLSQIKVWEKPRELDTIEWFGSPRDVCRAYAGLLKRSDKRLSEVLSANDAGLGLDRATWPEVWYKGGSEVGVFDMTFLGRTAKGKAYVVATLASDTRAPLDQGTVGPETISLSRGGFSLVR